MSKPIGIEGQSGPVQGDPGSPKCTIWISRDTRSASGYCGQPAVEIARLRGRDGNEYVERLCARHGVQKRDSGSHLATLRLIALAQPDGPEAPSTPLHDKEAL